MSDSNSYTPCVISATVCHIANAVTTLIFCAHACAHNSSHSAIGNLRSPAKDRRERRQRIAAASQLRFDTDLSSASGSSGMRSMYPQKNNALHLMPRCMVSLQWYRKILSVPHHHFCATTTTHTGLKVRKSNRSCHKQTELVINDMGTAATRTLIEIKQPSVMSFQFCVGRLHLRYSLVFWSAASVLRRFRCLRTHSLSSTASSCSRSRNATHLQQHPAAHQKLLRHM